MTIPLTQQYPCTRVPKRSGPALRIRKRRANVQHKLTDDSNATVWPPARAVLRFFPASSVTLTPPQERAHHAASSSARRCISVVVQGHTGLRRGVALAARKLGLPKAAVYRLIDEKGTTLDVDMCDSSTPSDTLLAHLHAPAGAAVTLIPLLVDGAETSTPLVGNCDAVDGHDEEGDSADDELDNNDHTDADDANDAHTTLNQATMLTALKNTAPVVATPAPAPASYVHNPYAAVASPPVLQVEVEEPALPLLKSDIILHPRLQAILRRKCMPLRRRTASPTDNEVEDFLETPNSPSANERRMSAVSPMSMADSADSLSSLPLSLEFQDAAEDQETEVDQVDRLFHAAYTAHYYENDWSRAVYFYNQVLAIAPTHLPSLAHRAALHEACGRWSHALNDHTELIRLSPTAASGWAGRGTLYHYRLGDSDRAYADYMEALRLDSSNIDTRLHLATLLARAYRMPEAALTELGYIAKVSPYDNRLSSLRYECMAMLG